MKATFFGVPLNSSWNFYSEPWLPWLRSKSRVTPEEWKSPEICNEKDEVFAEVSKDSIFGRLDSMKFDAFF